MPSIARQLVQNKHSALYGAAYVGVFIQMCLECSHSRCHSPNFSACKHWFAAVCLDVLNLSLEYLGIVRKEAVSEEEEENTGFQEHGSSTQCK